LAHSGWKLSFGALSTCWAGLDFSLMFHNYHAHWRKIKDLPPLVLIRRRVRKITLTMVTAMHLMEVHFIRVAPHLQRMALVPRLPAAFLATVLAQATRARLF
jgi:hypothetical protein